MTTLKVKRRFLIYIIIISFCSATVGQKKYTEILDLKFNDSINYYKNQLNKTDKLYFLNFKLGQLYYSKGTLFTYGELQTQLGNLTESYYRNFLDSAIIYFNISIMQNKKFGPSYYYRGLTQKNNQREDKLIDNIVLKDYTRAIKSDKNNISYLLERADYCSNHGITKNIIKKSIKDYSKVIKIAPVDCRAYLGRAITTDFYHNGFSKKNNLKQNKISIKH